MAETQKKFFQIKENFDVVFEKEIGKQEVGSSIIGLDQLVFLAYVDDQF